MRRRDESLERIAAERRNVEQRLDAVQAALASETGGAPRGRGWLIALVAGAAGLALALRRRPAPRPIEASAAERAADGRR